MNQKTMLAQGHIRQKQCRYGPMLYPVKDMYVGRSLDRYGEFSEGESELFRQMVRPGQVILEIGANIGAHTVMLAKATGHNGRIIAFEPQRILFQMLCANVALSGLTHVVTHWSAVGREMGTIVVPPLDYGKQNNFGGVSLGHWERGEQVRVVTVDSLGLTACHLIKIDVEGMEGEVLAGARETIERCRPTLYVENDRREKSAALIELLLGMNYRLYWHLPPLFNAKNFFGDSENIFGRIVSINMLCLPREVSQKIQGREITSPDDDWKQKG